MCFQVTWICIITNLLFILFFCPYPSGFQAVSNLMTLLLGEGYQASLFPESKLNKLFNITMYKNSHCSLNIKSSLI